jgi:hypothetical protein
VTRFTWAIVVGVLVLVGASVALAVVVRGRESPPDLSTPAGVTLAYALAFQRGDFPAAWDLLAESTKAKTTREEFLLRASGFRSTYDQARMSVEDAQDNGSTARVELVRTYSGARGPFGLFGGEYANRSSVQLTREPDGWRILVPPDPFVLTRPPRP